MIAPIVVGLTGGIGAGKSTFASLLAAKGATVIDVDAIGRAVIAPDGPGAAAVLDRFGTLERAELARIVFNDEAARHDLESISWPLIEAELRRRLAVLDADAPVDRIEVVVLDMAVLVQGLGRGIYGPVVTVEAPEPLRLARLVARGMTEADATARMRAQTSESVRRELATFVVVNDGDIDRLQAQADRVWAAL